MTNIFCLFCQWAREKFSAMFLQVYVPRQTLSPPPPDPEKNNMHQSFKMTLCIKKHNLMGIFALHSSERAVAGIQMALYAL